jgi:branched-chain amino acid transport system ATP-binding protein
VTVPALETRALVRRFGGLVATNDVSLVVTPGARHALIGPNGAGKTTLVNLVAGTLRPTSGAIFIAGEDITHAPPHRRVRKGLGRTFQITQLFPDLTPLETVALAVAEREGLSARALSGLAAQTAALDEAEALLHSLGLGGVMFEPTRRLAYGRRRLLELATALGGRPTLLLLDEPAAGVPEGERGEILDLVAALPRGVTVLLIEHDMDLVFRFAERITVLAQGAILAEGAPADIRADPRVRAVYLGEEAA